MKVCTFFVSIIIMGMCMSAIAETKMDLVSGPYGSGQIFVECEFDSVKRSCHFDTGASATFLQQDSETNSLTKIGTREFKTATDAKMVCDEVEVGSLKALNLKLSNYVIVRCPAPMKSTAGVDIVQNSKQYFNFKTATLSSFDKLPRTPNVRIDVAPDFFFPWGLVGA